MKILDAAQVELITFAYSNSILSPDELRSFLGLGSITGTADEPSSVLSYTALELAARPQ